MSKTVSVVVVCVLSLVLSGCRTDKTPPAPTPEQGDNIFAFTVEDIDGAPVSLSEFKGKVVLLVNVASKCGYTKQYADLQTLYEKYKDRGVVVLGFPANNFGGQEPGSNEEIKQFCSTRFNVAFPMFSKISVAGDDIHPLYAYLTDDSRNAPHGGAIQWNFTKFLIGKDGRTIERYASAVNPLDARVIDPIETALGGE